MPAKKGDKKTKKKPIKKTAKKKTRKRKPAKKKDKEAKKEIKEAVDKIPGLIFEQVEFEKPKKKPPTPLQPTFNQPQYYDAGERRKRGLMWLGVIILTVVIFVMWIWNTSSFMKDISSQEEKTGLWEQAKEDWKDVQNKEGDNNELGELLEKETDTNKLKAVLKQTLLNLIASSTQETATTTTSTFE